MTAEAMPSELHDAASTLASDPASTRGSASAWLVVAFALSFLGLVALTALMAAPAGGCGGG
jgi:hypothetical protein